MKRVFLLAVLFFFFITAAFGADFKISAGAGALYTGIFNQTFGLDDKEGTVESNDFGAFFYFDATYAEFEITLNYGTTKYRHVYYEDDKSGVTCDISLLGKYPFTINNFLLFPMAGITYQLNHIAAGLGFIGGLGADFPITDRAYIRGEILYGIRMWSPNADKTYDDTAFGHGPRVKVGVGYTL